MKMLLDPRLDLVFKKMLAADPEVLADLINSVLGLSRGWRILSDEVKNPDILPEEITQKYIILDILAADESGTRYDIEMQIRKYGAYPKRALYYVSRLYSGQLESGEDYEELKPVIGIHFLNYYQFPDHEDFRFCFELRDIRYPELDISQPAWQQMPSEEIDSGGGYDADDADWAKIILFIFFIFIVIALTSPDDGGRSGARGAPGGGGGGGRGGG